MRLERLRYPLSLLAVRRYLAKIQMWGKKKPVAPQAATSEPTDLQTNKPPGFPPALWERTPTLNSAAIHPSGATADRGISRMGVNLRLKGEISGSEDLCIEGTFEGVVQLDGRKLTVGTTAKVTADIVAGEVVVYGKVKGNIQAKGIEIKKDGSVNGDLTMAQILIEDGASFKGSIEIERSAGEEAGRNVLPPAA
jgi:cytoskeletal protein CcmA (bactofilin family)